MPILSNILGLDLGSHSLKAVEFRQNLRGFEAVAMRILPLADLAETPVEDADEGAEADPGAALSRSVAHFVRLHRLSTEHVVSALPGDRVSNRNFSFPFRDPKKLAQAVPFEVDEDSLFDIDDVIVDWLISGGDRTRANVAATVAPRVEVSNLLGSLRAAGCEPRTLEAEGLVLANLATLFDLPGTRMLVDLGHRKTTCCLISDGRPVAARTFPLAGAAITASLARDRALSPEEAERAKCESGVFGGPLLDVPPQTGATLERLAREILRTAASHEATIAGLDSGPLVELTLFGGTAQLERIDEYLAEHTGVPTARLGLPIEGRGNSVAAGGSPILFASAIALAVRGTLRSGMNFRQQEFAPRIDLGRYRGELAWPAGLAVVALLLALINIGSATALEGRRAAHVEEQIGQLYTDVFPGKPVPPNALAALRDEVRSAGERAEFLGVYRGNLSALDLLAEVSSRVPEDLDLLFEELSIDRQVIRMRVYAESFQAADRLGAELKKFPPFARARIGSIETDKKRGGKRFTVTIGLAETDGAG